MLPSVPVMLCVMAILVMPKPLQRLVLLSLKGLDTYAKSCRS